MRSTRVLTRRSLLGGLIGSGSVALLAACGASEATVVAPIARATAGATAASTVTRGASSPAATAPRAATPAATRTPTAVGTRVDTPLLRALALMSKRDPLPGDNGLSFADLATQKRNYGFGDASSLIEFRALNLPQSVLLNVVAGLPLPSEAGAEYASIDAWRKAVGYDFWQVEQALSVGTVPNAWTSLAGRFDRAEIAEALGRAGHTPIAYGGATIYSRGGDAELGPPNDPLTRYTLTRLNRVVLDQGALAASTHTALVEAGIDARAGRLATFAADPDYAALAGALGAVVGATLLPATEFLTLPPNPRATPRAATPRPTPGGATLPTYRLVGLGLRDDGTTHTMLVALLYDDPAAARAAAPIVRDRAANYEFFALRQPLRDRAVAGEPTIVTAGGRSTVVLPLAIADTANLGLWQRMLAQRDYGFLVP